MALPGYVRELARITGSEACLAFDACPHGGWVFSIDGYDAESSKPSWVSWSDWGWRAVVAAAADVAASGGSTEIVLYSVGAPELGIVMEVARGVGEAVRWVGARVLKADTNKSRMAWIDVAAAGPSSRPIARGGARPGDYVVQVGYVGLGALAKLALEGVVGVEELSSLGVLGELRRPKPPLGMGPVASRCGASAGMDNSDGWAATLATIAAESGVDIVLERILAHPLAAKALSNHGRPDEALLASWEDYNIAYTGEAGAVECILRGCRERGVPCMVVGMVVEGRGSLIYRGRRVEPEAWQWF